MNIVKPLFRNIKKPVINSVFGLMNLFKGRFFTYFGSTQQTHITTSTDVHIPGNLVTIEVVFKIEGGSDDYLVCLTTNSTVEMMGARIDAGYVPKFYTDGYSTNKGNTNLNDGNMHLMKLQVDKTTGKFSVFVDGVFDYGGVHSNPTALVDNYRVSIGARIDATSSSQFYGHFTGVIANVKIFSDDTLVFDMPVDEEYLPEYNSVKELVSGNDGLLVNTRSDSSVAYDFVGDDLVSEENEWRGTNAFKVGPTDGSALILENGSVSLERLADSNWAGVTFRDFNSSKSYIVTVDVVRMDYSPFLDDYGGVSQSRLKMGRNQFTVRGASRLDMIMKGGSIGDKVIISKMSIREVLTPQYLSTEARYFTDFDVATGMHVKLNEYIVLPRSGEWEVEIIAVIPTQGAYYFSDLDSTDGKDRAGVLPYDDTRVFLPTTVGQFIGGSLDGYYDDKKLRRIRYYNTENNVALEVDGELIHWADKGEGDPIINSLGKKFSGTTGVPNFRGVMASAKITINGEVITDIDINEQYSPGQEQLLNKGTGVNATIVNSTLNDSSKYELIGNQWINDAGDILENVSE